MSDSESSSKTTAMLSAIFRARPQLENFLSKNGGSSLAEYATNAVQTSHCLSPLLANTLANKLSGSFSDCAAATKDISLCVASSIDTSAHGGIFSEDTLVQSHAVLASGYQSKELHSFVSLACGVVPMNNATWPRGFFIKGARESIFPKSFDRVAFHECPAFTREMIEKKLADRELNSRSRKILELIRGLPSVFDQSKYFEQCTIVNHALWKAVSPSPDFGHFQLMLEDVTSELIIDAIEKDDALARLIFCKEKPDLFFELLSNLPGTWSPDRKKGTFLFWHASGDFRAASLWRDGDSLGNPQFSIPFDEKNIIASLRSRQIVPSVFLSLVSLLHNNVRPLGGYHQLAYLPEYQRRLRQFSIEASSVQCPDFLDHIERINLFNLGYGFAFINDPADPRLLAGIDAFIESPNLRDELWTKMNSTTVYTAIERNAKRLYLEIVPPGERSITFD